SWARTTPGGWTCWRTGKLRSMPNTSTSTGPRPTRFSHTRCWCPCWVTPTESSWSVARSSCASSRSRARSRSSITSTAFHWTRAPTQGCSTVHSHMFPIPPSKTCGALPDRFDPTPEQIAERHRNKEEHKRRLATLCADNDAVATAIRAAVRSFAGDKREAASFDPLHELLEQQAYRLAYWRVAADEINYRRFFDVNDLAALRVEHEAVFDATHKLVLELVREGKIDGLRIDHPDGLFDPAQYFRRLQSRIAGPGPEPDFGVAGEKRRLPIYLVVEKITASFESLPASWPVHGETGYHFANVVNRMLVDAATKARLDRVYQSFIGEHLEWQDVAYEAQHLVLRRSLASELNVVANRLARIAQTDRSTRDFTFSSVRQALAEVIACFPVYRTYVSDSVSAEDRRYIDWAIAAAKSRRSLTEAPVFDFVRAALLVELPST